MLVTCYTVNPSFAGELVLITVATGAKTTVHTFTGDYLGAGSLAPDGWFYFPAFRSLAIHRYNIWTGAYESNWLTGIPCSGCASDANSGLWRVRVFSDNRIYTMLYTTIAEDNCIRSFDLTTKAEYTPFLSTGACAKWMWDFAFLPSSSYSWPMPTKLPLSAPPQAAPMSPPVATPVSPPVAAPVAPPMLPPVSGPVAPPVLPPVSAPVVPAPIAAPVAPAPVSPPLAPPPAAAPVAPAPVTPPVASPFSPPAAPLPVAAPLSAPPIAVPQAVPASPPVVPPVFPRVARLVLNNVANRALTGPEIVSICNNIRGLTSISATDLACNEEVVPTARRAILESSFIKLNFTSQAGGQAAASVESSSSLRTSILGVPAAITSGSFAGLEIIFDPSPLLAAPVAPAPVAPAPVQLVSPQDSNVTGGDGGAFPVGAVVGGIIGALVLIAIIIIVIILVKRRKDKQNRVRKTDSAFAGTEYMAPMIQSGDNFTSLDVSKTQQSSAHDWNIEYTDLTFGEKIGSGFVICIPMRNCQPFTYLLLFYFLRAFGQVMKGRWRGGVVAIKEAQAISKDEFVKEANLMSNLRPHQNVVHLFGICIHKDHYYIVMEFLKGGDLLSMLRRAARRRPLNEQQRIRIALSIASGMLHLHAENILHRDLAARNVLLSRDGDIRISDFGMSHQAAADAESRIAAEVGPIRWMSPESLAKGVYSAKTDIFSFGILLWEIMSDGKIPMDDVPLKELALKRRDDNMIPELPENASPVLASLYKQCCAKKPNDRPTFKAVVKSLSDYLQANYADEDSDGPASPRDRAGSVLHRDRANSVAPKKNYASPLVDSTPEDETTNDMTSTVPSQSGAVPSGSRDDLSNAILPKKHEVVSTAKKSKREKGGEDSSDSTKEEESEDEAQDDEAEEEQAEEEEDHGNSTESSLDSE
jgi:serine/threonine protein kinase